MTKIECRYCTYNGTDFVQKYCHKHDKLRGYVHVMTRYYCPRCHHSFFHPHSDTEHTPEEDKTQKELLERWKRIKPQIRECENCGKQFFFDFDLSSEKVKDGKFEHYNPKYCSSLCEEKAKGEIK